MAQALRTVARSPVDNLAQSVDGGHSLRLHPGRPPPGPGCPPPPTERGHAPEPPRSFAPPNFLKFPRSPKTATVAPVPGTLRLGDRGSRGRCAKARQGAALGVWGCKPLPGSALGAAGTAQAKRAGGLWTPLGGAIYPEGANNIAQQCIVSPLSCKVAARALLLAA